MGKFQDHLISCLKLGSDQRAGYELSVGIFIALLL
jgi:hypothetical protein